MPLIKNNSYFVANKSVVLRAKPTNSSEPKNQLIYGDWLMFKGNTKGSWAEIFSRGNTGWIPQKAIQEERVLEVNFVDIGIGDGCHIVTPDDEIILIDAGKTDNMSRFINWRYNIRQRDVKGIDGIPSNDANAKDPMEIDYVVISHPDKDHYYGFKLLFENKKLSFKKLFHNGIFERPKDKANEDNSLHYYSSEDLGGYVTHDKKKYLWDTISSNAEMHTLIKRHEKSRKEYISTLVPLIENNPNVKFISLSHKDSHFDKFDGSNGLEFEVLGPVTEKIEKGTKSKNCLIRLTDEGKTKNGHSVIFKLKIGKLIAFLGGDLNTQSEDYLLRHYTKTDKDVSKLENKISSLKAKGDKITTKETQELNELESELHAIIVKGRKFFQVDIAKACHHGSHHFSESFLKCLNSLVTVVSSGDGDNYAHPRPDALGAFGKYGRGERPLIFSTEIGRSTREFTNLQKDLGAKLEKYIELREALAKAIKDKDKKAKKKLKFEMEILKDKNVATYGMITLRTDGEKVYLAQKLEVPRNEGEKWDIHELKFNANTGNFEYIEKH